MKCFVLIPFVFLTALATAQVPWPAPENHQKILIRYGTAHIGNGTVVQNAYIIIEGREISQVLDANKARINTQDFDTIIEAEGKHIYPGFTVMDSRLGLTEIDAIRATHDFEETGKFNPNVRGITAYNAESKIIPTVRMNGVLMAQIAPVGGRVSGSSSLVQLDAWNWEDAAVKTDEGIFLNWPAHYRQEGWWAMMGGIKKEEKALEETDTVYAFFEQAKAYAQMNEVTVRNLRFEAMRGLFDGSQRLYIRADRAREILQAVMFVKKLDIKKAAIVGGAESYLVTNELRENNIPVILHRIHSLPKREDTPIDLPYRLPSMLHEAGVKFAFSTVGDMEVMTTRNLPFQVGTAIAYGLDPEVAIQALTQVPAEIMGLSETTGTLEPGRHATFFLSEGDPLDIRSNEVTHAFIMGREIHLWSHQERLYEKYRAKYQMK